MGPIRARSPIPQHHRHGTSSMSPREPQLTPPPTFAINSSRDMLEKLKREIERLAGSIIRQECSDKANLPNPFTCDQEPPDGGEDLSG